MKTMWFLYIPSLALTLYVTLWVSASVVILLAAIAAVMFLASNDIAKDSKNSYALNLLQSPVWFHGMIAIMGIQAALWWRMKLLLI